MNNSVTDYIIISGLLLQDNNRGTAALGYGAISFLQQEGLLTPDTHILQIKSKGHPFQNKRKRFDTSQILIVGGQEWIVEIKYISFIEWRLIWHFLFVLPFGKVRRLSKQIKVVAAINGGDGFSDIYGTCLFRSRLPDIKTAMAANIPLMLLPQTIGPFKKQANYQQASKILHYANKIYVRDCCYTTELERMGVNFELKNDLSYYMQPEPFEIDVDKPNAIGINISGLAYYNNFHTLAGHFAAYSELIQRIVEMFQKMGKQIYLISHTYNYKTPEPNNDDLQAAKQVYAKLEDKLNVHLVDKNLLAPQVKYLISQMSFFVGTRMHANFAAIFTGVPLFGLAYSYKFKGAFERNGIFNRTVDINNLDSNDIDIILSTIKKAYIEDVIEKRGANE